MRTLGLVQLVPSNSLIPDWSTVIRIFLCKSHPLSRPFRNLRATLKKPTKKDKNNFTMVFIEVENEFERIFEGKKRTFYWNRD